MGDLSFCCPVPGCISAVLQRIHGEMSAKVADKRAEWQSINVDSSNFSFAYLENFYFVESCACNDKYDALRGDGRKLLYFAVQSTDARLSIQAVDLVGNSQNVINSLTMRVTMKDGTDLLTSFGSKLRDDGVLVLCIFNRNTILGIDLANKSISFEVNNIPCPNDLSISPSDPNMLFVAGGAGVRNPANIAESWDDTLAVMPPMGRVYQIDTRTSKVVELHSLGLSSLAGIESVQGNLYVSQLYEIVRLPVKGPAKRPETVWEGTEVGSGEMCYFSDNLSLWDERTLAVSVYREMAAAAAAGMQNSFLSVVGWGAGKCATSVYNFFTCAPNELDNAELLMSFSTKDVFVDVHFLLMDVVSGKKWHLKIERSALNLPSDSTFDGHVTHVQRHGGKLVCVNFKSNAVLVLDDKVVEAAIAK
jgi:hypothetical protein